jgi:mannosyl-oligosaccharide alpha-1,2-mannosidase
MGLSLRRVVVFCVSATLIFFAFRQLVPRQEFPSPAFTSSRKIENPVQWKDIPLRYTVSSMSPLPTGAHVTIPKIQHTFGAETKHNKEQRVQRQAAVKEAFLHTWRGYKKYAWLQDEVTPVTGGFKNGYGQRAATLVDTLDTLIIMGLDAEFEEAVKAMKKIDFTTSAVERLNVFETTIRYLGGLLSAHDLSKGKHRSLLVQATQLGDMLYAAFDTPNRMPISRWDWEKYVAWRLQCCFTLLTINSGALKGFQEADIQSISAELGSLTLEFTRLSQLTGDPKYYDAVRRITNVLEAHQNRTNLPGLFPMLISPLREEFDGETFTFGGMSDSLYEYFPKQHLLLGGLEDQYRKLYEGAIEAAKKHLFFRPMIPQNQNILISGTVRTSTLGTIKLDPEGQHLTCFAGGMVALAAKAFNRTEELGTARKLVDGCIWAYDSMPTGVMPETFKTIPCYSEDDCIWSTDRWHDFVKKASTDDLPEGSDVRELIEAAGLQPGFTSINDPRFLLR